MYRFREGQRVIENWDDDCEKAAGRAIIEMLQKSDIGNIVVVLSRLYSFKQCAADSVQQLYGAGIKVIITSSPKYNNRNYKGGYG